jgi:hypothetical protein
MQGLWCEIQMVPFIRLAKNKGPLPAIFTEQAERLRCPRFCTTASERVYQHTCSVMMMPLDLGFPGVRSIRLTDQKTGRPSEIREACLSSLRDCTLCSPSHTLLDILNPCTVHYYGLGLGLSGRQGRGYASCYVRSLPPPEPAF